MRQGKITSGASPSRPRGEGVSRRVSKRLSATDISALASMKNVAKCDTWCELQNPVNHRVFERKLRPKPSGRGHACLGVTHRVAPLARSPNGAGAEGADNGPPCAPARGRPKRDPRAAHVATSGGRTLSSRGCRGVPRRPDWESKRPDGAHAPLRPRPQVRRDHPLSLSISISGGKETYEDSPSNGERTGNGPT